MPRHTIDGAALDRIVADFMDREVARRVRVAKARCGSRRVRATITSEKTRIWVGTSGQNNIWHFLEYGTQPHDITATPHTGGKKALSWPTARHPVRRVHHPGTPEQAYMRAALYSPVKG